MQPESQPQRLGSAQGADSWAERNPHKAVQPARVRARPTDAQKKSQKIAAIRNKEARVMLSADILDLVATRREQIDELATKHSVTTQHIEKLVDNSTHYKKTRAPNLANALVHMKANELNEGIPECLHLWVCAKLVQPGLPGGSKLSLKEIKQAASDDPAYQHMSKEAKDEACAQLQAHRNLKATAARPSNASAAKDAVNTMAMQDREVSFISQSLSSNLATDAIYQFKMQALAERTGAHIITFMTRGHVDDQVVPGWYATSGTSHFFMDVLHLSAWDVLRMFEQWACAKSSSKFTPLSSILKLTRHHRLSSA